MARSTRFFLPQPAAAPHETATQRLRRKARTKIGRLVDRLILSLYRTISWLERRAPAERRYFRVAIFGSSRIQPADAAYARVRELARRRSRCRSP
jgi:hypothetical protein